MIFPYYDSLDEGKKEKIEDKSKVHKGKARLPKGIRGFDWPPSSPDLNPIEKV